MMPHTYMCASTVCLCWGTQVAVICGRNKKLLAELQRTRWSGGSHVVACGFVDNIHEVSSALTCTSALPSHDHIFLCDEASVIWGKTLRGLAAAVSRLLSLHKMSSGHKCCQGGRHKCCQGGVRAQMLSGRQVSCRCRCLERAAVRLSPAGVC